MEIISTINNYPLISLGVITALVTVISTLLMLYFTDQEHLRFLKKRNKELREELKKCQKSGDTCALEKVNQEMLEVSLKLMKASFSIKQLLITFIPFLILFNWLKDIYVPLYGNWWILYYLIFGMVFSSIYRKLFKMA